MNFNLVSAISLSTGYAVEISRSRNCAIQRTMHRGCDGCKRNCQLLLRCNHHLESIVEDFNVGFNANWLLKCRSKYNASIFKSVVHKKEIQQNPSIITLSFRIHDDNHNISLCGIILAFVFPGKSKLPTLMLNMRVGGKTSRWLALMLLATMIYRGRRESRVTFISLSPIKLNYWFYN